MELPPADADRAALGEAVFDSDLKYFSFQPLER